MAKHVMVFAPAPRLTVTVERRGDTDDIHLHAGGQGIWQARMVLSMGVPVVLCTVFGGETGQVVRQLLIDEGIDVRSVSGQSRCGAYVHDRRGGDRRVIAETPAEPLSRHEVDEVYGLALAEGLHAGVSLLGGPGVPPVVTADVYRRLTADLVHNGSTVVADLAGEHLAAAAAARVRVLKTSHDELLDGGRAGTDSMDDLLGAIVALRREGAETVIVTRAERPALALIGEEVYEVIGPRLEAADPAGAGDSMTAAVAASLARGESIDDAIRTGAAAGAINVTRRGLGTAEPDAVRRLREQVRLKLVRATEPDDTQVVRTTPEELSKRVRQQ